MTRLGECIADLIIAASKGRLDAVAENARSVVAALCNQFPIALVGTGLDHGDN
jgi:hypothetical protein